MLKERVKSIITETTPFALSVVIRSRHDSILSFCGIRSGILSSWDLKSKPTLINFSILDMLNTGFQGLNLMMAHQKLRNATHISFLVGIGNHFGIRLGGLVRFHHNYFFTVTNSFYPFH